MAFLVSENKNRNVEGLPSSELDFYLSRFVLAVRRKSGVEYKTSTPSLRRLISSVYRHLMGTFSGTSTEWPSSTQIWIELELEMLVFEERGKPEYPENNLSEQRREPTTNSTQILRRVRESIPSNIGATGVNKFFPAATTTKSGVQVSFPRKLYNLGNV